MTAQEIETSPGYLRAMAALVDLTDAQLHHLRVHGNTALLKARADRKKTLLRLAEVEYDPEPWRTEWEGESRQWVSPPAPRLYVPPPEGEGDDDYLPFAEEINEWACPQFGGAPA